MVNQKEYKHISVFAKERNKSPKVKTKPSKPRAKTTADDYKQSVKGSFVENIEEEVYTMAEICSKFNYTYGRFYNLRMRYHIPCTKGQATKCFPKAIIDRVMQEEAERLGRQQTDHWYTSDLQSSYQEARTHQPLPKSRLGCSKRKGSQDQRKCKGKKSHKSMII